MKPLALVAAILSVEIEAQVPVYVGASFPRVALERALDEAERLFREGGVRLKWNVSPAEPLPDVAATVVVLDQPSEPLVTGCRRNLHDHRLGHTHIGARRITLWQRQVARAVTGDWDAREISTVDDDALGVALGRVLAHELGHLFLRLDGHRDSGLMRPSFSHRSLTGKSDRLFRLSTSDWRDVRTALERLRLSAPGRESTSEESCREISSASTFLREE